MYEFMGTATPLAMEKRIPGRRNGRCCWVVKLIKDFQSGVPILNESADMDLS
jgi:hypothetical protein